MSDTKESTELQVLQPSALEHLTRGEIDTQIATAKKYPRSIQSFMKTLLDMATISRATAGRMFYRLPRREFDQDTRTYVDKIIEGPSIRMAELAAGAFGNLRFGARVVEIGDESVTGQGFCHDLERNTACAEEVTASIVSKKGTKFPTHMVITTANAARSKALRNAVLRIIPRAYIDQVLRECKDVALGKGMTMVERWNEIVGSFSKHGTTPAQLLASLGRKGVTDVTTDDMVHLQGLLTAIEDGEITVDAALRPQTVQSVERSTIADDATPEQLAEIERKRKEAEELTALVQELRAIDPEAVENVTRRAPDQGAALEELRRMKAAVEARKKNAKPVKRERQPGEDDE